MARRAPVHAPHAPTLHVAEPAAAYRRRPALVVDASVLAAALFGEARHALAVSTLQVRALAAPQLVDYELGNVALNKLRSGAAGADVRDAMQDFLGLDLARHPVDLPAALALAQRYRLSACDAAYLWLAEHLQAPLATLDDKLAEAARRHLTQESRPDEPA
ncbi:MAG: type II toxin-antitoxin system VapC family toxin [Burkholderiales bacterium]|jgi:predicted nucleic acid-binding protein|nr:type II toxin-antitoxin system VapC family toxin [Burkholderiales bacterium]